MNLLLFFLFAILTIFAYFISQRKLLSPSVIANGMFCFSSLIVVFCTDKWNYIISFKTVIFLTLSMTLFTLYEYIGENYNNSYRISLRSKIQPSDKCSNTKGIDLSFSKHILVLMVLITIMTSFFYFINQYRLSIKLGNTSGVFGMFSAIRTQVIAHPEYFQLNALLNIGISFTRSYGYICMYICIVKISNAKNIQKGIILYTIPVLCLAINAILSTGRGEFITIIVAMIYDIFIVLKMQGRELQNSKLLKYCAIGIAAFIAIFIVLGNIRAEGNLKNGYTNFSIYVASSIICFDNYLGRQWTPPDIFGEDTLRGINNILNKLGFDIPTASRHGEMVRWGNGYSSNVYTSFYPYVHDFDIIGSIILTIIIGFIFGKAWRAYYESKSTSFLNITYGVYFGYATVMFSIAERFAGYLSLNNFVTIFFYFLIIKFLLNKTEIKHLS